MQYNHLYDEYRIVSTDTLRRCIYGGKGVICLVAPSGKAHKYKFSKPLNDSFPDDVIFVSVLHESKYFYIGMIEKEQFRRTKNSRFDESNESVKGAKFIVQLSNSQSRLATTSMKLFHNGRCSVCGRIMKSTKAIQNGVGPKCLPRLNARLYVQQKLDII